MMAADKLWELFQPKPGAMYIGLSPSATEIRIWGIVSKPRVKPLQMKNPKSL